MTNPRSRIEVSEVSSSATGKPFLRQHCQASLSSAARVSDSSRAQSMLCVAMHPVVRDSGPYFIFHLLRSCR